MHLMIELDREDDGRWITELVEVQVDWPPLHSVAVPIGSSDS
jgi:hypothetical protein